MTWPRVVAMDTGKIHKISTYILYKNLKTSESENKKEEKRRIKDNFYVS